MRTKEQIKNLLLSDPFYSSIIKDLDDENRKRISEIVEPFFIDAMTVFEQAAERVNNDPKSFDELMRGVEERLEVINATSNLSSSKE